MAPEDMEPITEKIASTGNTQILLTERGTSFGYHNLVVDMRSIVILGRLGYPVVFDATHSVQLPGEGGSFSGGKPAFILPLARAAVATGVDALFVETHPCPSEALCDAATMLPLEQLEDLLYQVVELDSVRRKGFETVAEPKETVPVSHDGIRKEGRVQLLILDVDGVLTNGQVLFNNEGELGKAFNVHDGKGIRLALESGIQVALISGRASEAAMRRASELGVQDCLLHVSDKVVAYEELVAKYGLRDEEIACVGDDVEDLQIMRRAGFAVAVSTAMPLVKLEADYVTRAKGGSGAVREVVELILEAQREYAGRE